MEQAVAKTKKKGGGGGRYGFRVRDNEAEQFFVRSDGTLRRMGGHTADSEYHKDTFLVGAYGRVGTDPIPILIDEQVEPAHQEYAQQHVLKPESE